MSSFQHLTLSLFTVGGTIWAYEISKIIALYFYSFLLFAFYTASYLFWNWGYSIKMHTIHVDVRIITLKGKSMNPKCPNQSEWDNGECKHITVIRKYCMCVCAYIHSDYRAFVASKTYKKKVKWSFLTWEQLFYDQLKCYTQIIKVKSHNFNKTTGT